MTHTIPVEDGMRVRHDAHARFVVKTGQRVLEDRLVPAELVGGAFTTASFMYNRLSMSGGTSWWDPSTGMPITRPKITVTFRPEDVLAEGQECGCAACEESP